MPRIRQQITSVSASAGGPGSALPPTPSAQGRDFYGGGEDIGDALQQAAGGVRALGMQLDANNREQRERQEREDLANLRAQADPTPTLISASNGAREDGSDLRTRTDAALTKWIDDQTNNVENPRVRSALRIKLLESKAGYLSNVSLQAETMRREYTRQQTDRSLSTLENRVRTDPLAYDEVAELGAEVLQAQPHLNTEGNRANTLARLARAKFEGQIEQTRTTDDVDRVAAELKDEKWQAILTTKGYDEQVDALTGRRASLRTAAVVSARASITDLETRTNNGNKVDHTELVAVNAQVNDAADPQLAARLGRVARNQSILKRHGSSGAAQLSALASAARTSGGTAGLSPEAGKAVDAGVMFSGGRVSGSYLAATATMESGANVSAGKHSDAGTAYGLYGFTDDTWLSVVKKSGDALLPDAGTMTDAEILEARKDVELQSKAAVSLAISNRDTLTKTLARDVSEYEVYLAHFLGAGKATAFIQQYEQNENADASDMLPREAEANPGVFKDKGKSLTVGEVYDRLSAKFSSTPGRVQSEDAEFVQDMADAADKRERENMMGYAREVGIAAVPPLTQDDGPEARARAAHIVSSTWRIPMQDVKPLEPTEVNHYKNLLSDENPDTRLEVMAVFDRMGPVLAQQAYKQLGVDGAIYGHAAGLLTAGGDPAAAYSIVRGRTYMDNNPDFAKSLGFTTQDVIDKYGTLVSEAVGNIGDDAAAGGAWQSVMDAATAHYIQTTARSGKIGLDFDAFERSLNAVLGGTDAAPVLSDVNGRMTVLPVGMSSSSVDAWLDWSTAENWKALSVRGLSPRYEGGGEISPEDIRSRGTFVAVGKNRYVLQVDGMDAGTGRTLADGKPEAFVFEMNAATMKSQIAASSQAARQADKLSPPEISYLVGRYGALWTYDPDTGAKLSADEIAKRRLEARDSTRKTQ